MTDGTRMGHESWSGLDERLQPLEKQIMGWVSTHRTRLVLGVALCITIISVSMTVVAMAIIGLNPRELGWRAGVGISALVPVTVSPIILWYVTRLLSMLEQTATSLRRAATTDPLTSTLNRRGFFELVDGEGATRTAHLTMVDLDDFKTLNDTRGHDFGDLALRAVADHLSTSVGQHGTVARIDGDEFVCVSDIAAALQTQSRDQVVVDGVVVTMSLGTAVMHPDVDLTHTLREADAALYNAKDQRAA